MDASETHMLKDFIFRQEGVNKTILSKFETLHDDVQVLKRGLYGDTLNGVPGLIQRQEIDEKRIDNLENDTKEIKATVKGIRNKLVWTGAGFVAGLQALWEFIKWKSK